MPRRKKTVLSKIPEEYKTNFFALILLFFGVIVFIGDTNSKVGFFLDNILTKGLGEYYKWLFSPIVIVLSVFLLKERNLYFNLYRFFGLIFYIVSLTTIIGFFNYDYKAIFNLFPILENVLGGTSTLLTFIILFFTSFFILFRFSIFSLLKLLPSPKDLKTTIIKENSIKTSRKKQKVSSKKELQLERMLEKLRKEKEALKKQKKKKQLDIGDINTNNRKIKIVKKKSISSIFGLNKTKENNIGVKKINIGKWEFPEINLLKDRKRQTKIDVNEIRRKELEIQEKLLQFRIEVSMEDYKIGPTVIQYRLKPMRGVKLQKIVNLKKDLTLALQAKNIRIQAPIPGLGVVGIEVPNDNREIVGLKDLIESRTFNNQRLSIPIAIGKDVSGGMVVGDLSKMPHLLVAGQTASGKSVGMNGFLISMLYKFGPNALKFIMVDPKRVELSVYNGIPHLLTPVITNPEKAVNALKWCVAEMLRRYDLATKKRARNFKEYNSKVDKKDKLPYIVIVIDELADLMMSGMKKEVEGNIARIAQMARAVGMHLIVATQRPSVDVITGLIKANIPSRIAFTVASQIDSRTVIDKMGAEDLLGMGDMLYYPTGALEPERVQGVFVDTDEVESVVNKLKLTIDPDMLKNLQDPSIVNSKSKFEGSILEGYKGDQNEDPEIIEKAIKVVKDAKKGSTSLVQRKLGLGYARAAKILDILEELGVVGPANGSKPREVYVD